MNKTADLVSLWADYDSKHPGTTIKEFCRYYLVSNKLEEESPRLFDGEMPPRQDIILSKLLDRISRLHMVYIHIAMQDLKIKHFEEFSLLSAVANLSNPRKTEVIYHTINELSTGLNLLGGLKKRGYITEHEDPEDGRSKRLKLTAKGEQVLQSCYERFSRVPEILFMEMPEEDIKFCIQLLWRVETKFSKLYLQDKDKTFQEVYKDIKGEKLIEKGKHP